MPAAEIKSHQSDHTLAFLLFALNRSSFTYGDAVTNLFSQVTSILTGGELKVKRTLRCEIGWRDHGYPSVGELATANADLPPPTMKFMTHGGDEGVVTAHFEGDEGINKVTFTVSIEDKGKQVISKAMGEVLNSTVKLPEVFQRLVSHGSMEVAKFSFSLHPWATLTEHAKSHELTTSNCLSSFYERRAAGRSHQVALFGQETSNVSANSIARKAAKLEAEKEAAEVAKVIVGEKSTGTEG
jgi:hypothetical protein